ncbi:hypothetical protein [Polaribacter aquimarinus]|uniref:Lipoprotein n=1 Tax=Polaribacter aquimarinus TaxID=2100726 RepID=A0A2U2J766_9FLAO|nr:hypothetical protein [Polaribacter aquimarinus]PWG04142.1 hypothetical protein DIS07_14345 [Polaribacter aquimarinus]
MKNLNLLVLVASITFVFSSCSSNETILPEEQSLDLLKTYTIKRDASGAYSLDFDLNNGGKAEKVLNTETKTNQIYLYSSDDQSSSRVTQDLTIEGTQLKVGFVDTTSDKLPQIMITDDNPKLLSKNNNKKLNDYSITSNGDGTYSLDFNVKRNVKVDFVYNNELSVYEVHLEDGKSKSTSFTRVLENEDGKPLKVDFVNHNRNSNKGEESLAYSIIRKPKVTVGEGSISL